MSTNSLGNWHCFRGSVRSIRRLVRKSQPRMDYGSRFDNRTHTVGWGQDLAWCQVCRRILSKINSKFIIQNRMTSEPVAGRRKTHLLNSHLAIQTLRVRSYRHGMHFSIHEPMRCSPVCAPRPFHQVAYQRRQPISSSSTRSFLYIHFQQNFIIYLLVHSCVASTFTHQCWNGCALACLAWIARPGPDHQNHTSLAWCTRCWWM